ncbi:MAG TPA: hypothetical protein VEV17_20860 [Bryobacteraceae bacterium]|nr:hypothetical protein [Bryobacteraceae bacterium]
MNDAISSRILAQTRVIVERGNGRDGWSLPSRPLRQYCEWRARGTQAVGTGGKGNGEPLAVPDFGTNCANGFEVGSRPKREGAVAGLTGILAGSILGLTIWLMVGKAAHQDYGPSASISSPLKTIFAVRSQTAAPSGQAQVPSALPQAEYEHAKQLVEQAVRDLRVISQRDTLPKDQEGYNNALRSLSGFGQALSHGKLDTSQLEDAIETMNGVAKSNALELRERKTLRADVRNLRALRAGRKSVT